MVSHRTFGVEIECGHDDHDNEDILDLLCQQGFKDYSSCHDGSGTEIQTRILKGESGYRELAEVMDYLSLIGCYVCRRDGMHVHIGAASFVKDEKAVSRLARTWYSNQDIIGRMVSDHRIGRGCCPRFPPGKLETLGKKTEAYANRKSWGPGHDKDWGTRGALNLQNLPRTGTIEFRLHEGCLDPVKAIAWVKFCQKLIDHSAKSRRPLSCASSKTELLRSLEVPEDAVTILKKAQPTMPETARQTRVVAR